MDYPNQSSLRFSLEESIWFVEGQEVAELYSLSIDPDVTVTEENEYVVIEGRLQVSGEYRGVEVDATSENPVDDEGPEQYVHRVEQREEDEVCVFFHDFPVNISIPTNRVMNREVVEIDISSFDYHMPENRCIKLFAELTIIGIYDEDRISEQDASSYDHTEEETFLSEQKVQQVSVSLQPTEYESFTAEAFALPRDEEQETQSEQEENTFHFQANNMLFNPLEPNFSFSLPMQERTEDETFGNVPPFDNQISAMQEQVNRIEESASVLEPVQIRSEQGEGEVSISEITEVKPSREVESVTESFEEDVPIASVFESSQVEESIEAPPMTVNTHGVERQVHRASEEPEKEKVRESAKATVHLTDFFAKKETQARTSLKVCIVQNGDSLSDLATRYSVNKLDIMSYNDLNSENDVYEGQVLYIPKSTVHK